MSIRTQSEHYRRHQSQLLPDGRGLTMGALYWQLNDIWQAPTWASIDHPLLVQLMFVCQRMADDRKDALRIMDSIQNALATDDRSHYSGSWKMLHYYAKSFFNKNLISPYYLDDNTLDVFIVVDEIAVKEVKKKGVLSFVPARHAKDLDHTLPAHHFTKLMKKTLSAIKGTLRIDMYLYSSFKPIHSWTVSYNLTSTAESVFRKPIADLLSESGCPAKQKCMLYLSSTDASGLPVSSTSFALTYPKHSVLPQTKVQATHFMLDATWKEIVKSVVKLDSRTFEIELSSDAVALYVWLSLDSAPGHFSDNGFHMISDTVTVNFFSSVDVSLDQLTSELRVRSLTDVHTS